MENKLNNKIFFFVISLSILLIHQIFFQKFFPNSQEGLYGHDFEQFIPNLIFGKIWFHKHFLSIPWFTPTLCCGMPSFPDPQSMFYSIYQIVFLLFNPIISVKIIFFLLSLVAFYGMFALLRSFGFAKYTSLVCATLFLFNSFFIYRSIVGHLAYLSYVFVPLYCFFLIKSYEKRQEKLSILYLVLSSIIFANFFYSGSGPIILIIFASILTIVFFYYLINKNLNFFYKFLQSLLFGFSISLSKIFSSLFFLSNFPRQYSPTEFTSFLSYIKIFFSSFFFKVDENFFNENVISMIPFGRHEMEYSLGIVPILCFFLIFLIGKKNLKENLSNLKLIVLLFAIFIIPVILNLNFLGQYYLISKIPIISSTWVQFRWMAIYIIPIIIISGFLIEKARISEKYKKYLSLCFIIIIIFQNALTDNSNYTKNASYNISDSFLFNKKLDEGFEPDIVGPSLLLNKDGSLKKITNRNDAFYFSYSSLTCYQPIYGYGLENLNGKNIKFYSKRILGDGSILYYSNKKDKNKITFFNPACFLFPKENDCLPGDIFNSEDYENLEKFLSFEKIDFKQNSKQMMANYISLISVILSIIILIYFTIIFFFFRKKINS